MSNLAQHSIYYNPHVPRYELKRNGRVQDTAPVSLYPAFFYAWKAARHNPQLVTRLWKAAQLVTAGHVELIPGQVKSGYDHHLRAKVTSQSDSSRVYTITQHINSQVLRCHCQDWASGAVPRNRERLCKHIVAVYLQRKLNQTGLPPQSSPQPPVSDSLKNEKYRRAWVLRRASVAKRAQWRHDPNQPRVRRRGVIGQSFQGGM